MFNCQNYIQSSLYYAIQKNLQNVNYYTVYYSNVVGVVRGSESDNVDCHRRFINKVETKFSSHKTVERCLHLADISQYRNL